jgi:hypothetical protein
MWNATRVSLTPRVKSLQDVEVVEAAEAPYSKADLDTWNERAGVRKEIEALAEQYNNSPTEPPPFSAPELIIMAALCSHRHVMNSGAVFEWAVKSFVYYRDQAANKCHRIISRDNCSISTPTGDSLIDNYYQNFDCWEAPFAFPPNAMLTTTMADLAYFRHHRLHEGFTVPRGAGRIYLRKWLEPERRGTFNFLGLPAEIRNAIYELVFSLPESGVRSTTAGVAECCACAIERFTTARILDE